MVDFNRDRKDEGYSMVWKYETGDWVNSVSITPNGEYVVAGSRDYHVYLFNRRGELLWKYWTGDDVYSVSITPDGEYVVAGSEDKHVYLFISPYKISKITLENAKSTISKIKYKYIIKEAESLLSQAESLFKE